MADNMQLSDDEARFLEEGGLNPGLIDPNEEQQAETLPQEAEAPVVDAQEAPEQAAEAAEKPEDAQDSDKGEKDPERNGFVPYSRFKEVNERSKAAEARADKMTERLQAFLDRQAEAAKPPQQEAPKPPDPNEQPFEFMEYQRGQLEQTNDRLSQFEQQQRAAQEAQAVQQHFVAEASQYATEKPDFGQAYQHLHRAMVETARVAGSQNPEHEATQFELNIVRNAAMQGRNTAEVLYGMASQFGYQPSAPATDNQAATPSQDTAAEKVQHIDDAQRRHRSLSSGGGNAAPGAISADRVAAMSDEEFNELLRDKQAYKAYEAALANAG